MMHKSPGPQRNVVPAGKILLRTGFRRIVTAQAAELRRGAAESGSDDPEAVHRQRVAIRRLRSVLALFRPCLEPEAAARFDAELRELGLIYGAARDWDMACLKSFPAAMEEAPAPIAAAVLVAADAARRAAHVRLRESQAGGVQARLADALTAWAAGSSCIAADAARVRLASAAPALLDRLDRKAIRRGRRIDERSRAELHALRRALKRLNYGTEALAMLYPPAEAVALHASCAGLLDLLGRMNDAAVALTLARGIDDERVQIERFVRPWAKRRRRKAKRRLHAAWRAFRAAPRPWL